MTRTRSSNILRVAKLLRCR